MAKKPDMKIPPIGDDLLNIIKKLVGKQRPNSRGTMFPKNQALPKRKFDQIYGKGSAKELTAQSKRAEQFRKAKRAEENLAKPLNSYKEYDITARKMDKTIVDKFVKSPNVKKTRKY